MLQQKKLVIRNCSNRQKLIPLLNLKIHFENVRRRPPLCLITHAEAESSSSTYIEPPKAEVSNLLSPSRSGDTVVKLRRKSWLTIEKSLMILGGLKILISYLYGNPTPPASIRTIAGRFAWFLQIPIALLLCFISKKIVDWRVHKWRFFMPALLISVVMAHLYIPYLIFRPGPGMKMHRILEARERRIQNPMEKRLQAAHRSLQARRAETRGKEGEIQIERSARE